MDLTEKNKEYIDSLSMESLLAKIRFSPLGDSWFQGETGDYIMKRYTVMRDQDHDRHVAASKMLGWKK